MKTQQIFFYLSALEESGGCREPATLHMGRHFSLDPVPAGEGTPLLPLSQLHRVRGPRVAPSLPRGLCLPQKGASLLHPLHSWPLLLHGFAGPAYAPGNPQHG